MGNVGPLSESLLSRTLPPLTALPGPTPPAVVEIAEAEMDWVTEGAGLDPR